MDNISIDDYPAWARVHWTGIKRGLVGDYYCPQPVKRVEIPKPKGGVRLLGIPCVNDRVIQQAIVQVLQPIIDPHFSAHSYGFRPKRSAHDAVKAVRQAIKDKYRYAVDIDLSKFFDNIDHDLLMVRLARWVDDKRVLKLIGKILRAGVSIQGEIQPTLRGAPQGGALSPLLANILLNDLDGYLEGQNLRFARYADDFVIGVNSENEGLRVKAQVEAFLMTLKLPINHEKSQVVRFSQLHFLGFVFRGKRIVWSVASLMPFKARIRQLTGRSWRISWVCRYQQLRKHIAGWMNYFALSEYYRPIPGLDEWLRRRIRMGYLKQWRKPKTRIRRLLSLGMSLKQAIMLGMSRKGYYRLARTQAVQWALNNQWLCEQGLISIKQQWVKFHYANGR